MSQENSTVSAVLQSTKQVKYFCYVCEKVQTLSCKTFRCCLCDSQSIEQIRQEDPSNFNIYEVEKQMNTQKIPLGFLDSTVNERRHGSQSRIRFIERTSYTMISLSSSSNIPGSFLEDMMTALFGDEDQDEGVTQEQIQKLTKIEETHKCSICQTSEGEEKQEFQGNQGRGHHGYKLKCDHTFHAQCIEPWLKMKNTCPLCRKSISE